MDNVGPNGARMLLIRKTLEFFGHELAIPMLYLFLPRQLSSLTNREVNVSPTYVTVVKSALRYRRNFFRNNTKFMWYHLLYELYTYISHGITTKRESNNFKPIQIAYRVYIFYFNNDVEQ